MRNLSKLAPCEQAVKSTTMWQGLRDLTVTREGQQEIHVGEETGLSQWREALQKAGSPAKATRAGASWPRASRPPAISCAGPMY